MDENQWDNGYDYNSKQGPFFDAVMDEATDVLAKEDNNIPVRMLESVVERLESPAESVTVSVPVNEIYHIFDRRADCTTLCGGFEGCYIKQGASSKREKSQHCSKSFVTA